MTGAAMSLDGLSLREWQRRFERYGETPAIPAATVVVLRDSSKGIETLLLRRRSDIAFAGMWVFPGGRIEHGDHEHGGHRPEDHRPEDDEHPRERPGDGRSRPRSRRRIEYGDHEHRLEPPDVLASNSRASAGDMVAAARQAAVREAREEADIVLDPSALVLFSFWLPPPIAPKRYATWFFAATEPGGEVRVDDGEIVRHEWMTPAEAMRRRDVGEIMLAPPTWVTLHTLHALSHSVGRPDKGPAVTGGSRPDKGSTVTGGSRPGSGRTGGAAQVLDGLARGGLRRYETRIGAGAHGPVSMWHGDAGYETSDPSVPGARHRLEFRDGGYHLDRTAAPETAA